MIRFRRLFGATTAPEQRKFDQMKLIFDHAFSGKGWSFAQIRDLVNDPELDFEPILLIAENQRGRVIGLSVTFFFPDLRYAYLQYIASDPERARRGIGGALYEALRDLLVQKGARGLFLDLPPTDSAKLADPSQAGINRRRLRFYESYGARQVLGTAWDEEPNPRNANVLTSLVFDPLGRPARLPRAAARNTARRILVAQYGYPQDAPFVHALVGSFRDDPVRLREPAGGPLPAPPVVRGRLAPLTLVVSKRHTLHHLREKGYVERPARVDSILRGLERVAVQRREPRRFSEKTVLAVHDRRLVAFLKRARTELPPGAIVYAEVFPPRHRDRLPEGLADQAGYFAADTFSPVTANTWAAAKGAADCALTAMNEILEGERLAYALCRPPGHHAERNLYGGYCFLNNSAIAANELSAHGTVALLDLDFHHGNGGQDIFWERKDVFTLSLHGDPRHAYPNYSGFADETGAGEGAGFNLNLPLPPGTGDEAYLGALAVACDRIAGFRPDYLVVSLGFDVMSGDPTGNFQVTGRGIRHIGEAVGRLKIPSLVVQEGGYSLRNLRTGAHAFFSGLARSWY